MICIVCYKHCNVKKPCAGCLPGDDGKPEHCRKCKIKDCIREKGMTYCFKCVSFPCKFIENLEKSYNQHYSASLFVKQHFCKKSMALPPLWNNSLKLTPAQIAEDLSHFTTRSAASAKPKAKISEKTALLNLSFSRAVLLCPLQSFSRIPGQYTVSIQYQAAKRQVEKPVFMRVCALSDFTPTQSLRVVLDSNHSTLY